MTENVLFKDNVKWEMSPGERIAIIGLLLYLKPDNVLEIGVNEGGCTRWMAQYAKQVVAVDIERRFGSLPDNVSFMKMPSSSAFEQFLKQGKRFDLILIDGDHSESGAYNDLEWALDLGQYILIHDTFNPECRKGYTRAVDLIKDKGNHYINLDFIQGNFVNNMLWGGLGIIITNTCSEKYIMSDSVYNYVHNTLHERKRGAIFRKIITFGLRHLLPVHLF